MTLAIRLVRYHLYSYWNWKEAYIGRFIEPLAYFLFLIGGISSSIAGNPNKYIKYSLLGMCVMQTFRAGIGAASDVSNDRKWGVYAIFQKSGGNKWSYICSIVIFQTGIVYLQCLLLYVACGAMVGFDLRVLCKVLLFTLSGSIAWICVGCFVGSKVDSYALRDFVVSVFSLPIVLSAPLFYYLDSAPMYLRLIAYCNPLTYQVCFTRMDDWRIGMMLSSLVALCAYITASIALGRASSLSRERL